MESDSAGVTTRRESDPLFGLLSGLYAALLVAPVVALGITIVTATGGGLLYGAIIGTGAVVTGLGWWRISGRPGMAIALGATRKRWIPIGVPIVYAFLGFASLSETGVIGVLAFFFGLVAFVFGVVLAVMARTRYTAVRTADLTPLAQWTAGWPESDQRRRLRQGSMTASVAAVGFVVGTLFEYSVLQYTGQVLFPSGFVLISTGHERSVTATKAGLEVSLPVARRFYAWEELEEYDLDSESLVVTRRWGTDLRFATEDIDDISLVEWTLAEQLTDV